MSPGGLLAWVSIWPPSLAERADLALPRKCGCCIERCTSAHHPKHSATRALGADTCLAQNTYKNEAIQLMRPSLRTQNGLTQNRFFRPTGEMPGQSVLCT